MVDSMQVPIESRAWSANESADDVRQLQRNLIELGFVLVGEPDGVYGRSTQIAVREFQIYAKMDFVAAELRAADRYVDRLSSVPNTLRYAGPVSGVANAETRARIRDWLDRRWRCPVVVEAWTMADDARDSLHRENIWWHDDVTNESARMFVRDFSGYYRLPQGRDPNELIGLGQYVMHRSWSGPLLTPPKLTWPESEILPGNLVGVDLAGLSGPQRSTFKVVRAVAEVECVGFFDGLNAYDNAFVSVGPCHWTLGIVGASQVDEGELCGFLAYLRYADPPAFASAIGFFGVRADEDWTESGVPDGSALFQRSSRKYVGWVATEREGGGHERFRQDEDSGNYFKSWHWFYRFAMAGRTNAGWRRAMWTMARIRLRDILATPFPRALTPDLPDGGGTRRAMIGDVYTSERALAVLLRWHIRFPSHVISGGQIGGHLRDAFLRAGIPASAGHARRWGDAEERTLLDGLIGEIGEIGNKDLINTVNSVRRWPAWRDGANPRRYQLPDMGDLSVGRNSFLFEASGLPPAPWERHGEFLVATARALGTAARRHPVLLLALTSVAAAAAGTAWRARRTRGVPPRPVPGRGRP